MFFDFIRYLLGFGQGIYLFAFFLAFYAYYLWRLITLVIVRSQAAHASPSPAITARQLTSALLLVTLALLILLGTLAFIVAYTNYSSPYLSNINLNNYLLARADYALFGVYPPLWLSAASNPLLPIFSSLSRPLIYVYTNLGPILSLTLLVLFIFRARLAIQLFVTSYLCVVLSLPFWYFFPATSPVITYYYPAQPPILSPLLADAISDFSPSPALINSYTSRVAANTIGPITTIPSMHIAWATIIAWFLFMAWPGTAILTLPYLFINHLSALITLQHYAVDIIAGTLITIPAIIIATRFNPDRFYHLHLLIRQKEADRKALTGKL